MQNQCYRSSAVWLTLSINLWRLHTREFISNDSEVVKNIFVALAGENLKRDDYFILFLMAIKGLLSSKIYKSKPLHLESNFNLDNNQHFDWDGVVFWVFKPKNKFALNKKSHFRSGIFCFAEREGFEPSVQLPVRQFSKLFLSATQASLRNRPQK